MNDYLRQRLVAERARAIGVRLAVDAGDRLTEREIAILKDISEGRANKEIARRLNVSVDTVKADMKRIFSKLDVTDRTRAVIVAIQRGSLCI
ncbi:MAG: response regulator transcription factor [Brevundimonas sp.]